VTDLRSGSVSLEGESCSTLVIAGAYQPVNARRRDTFNTLVLGFLSFRIPRD
jgi:hypothetical protein